MAQLGTVRRLGGYVVRALFAGSGFGFPTLVETEAQHALLLSRGCTEAQGYLLGRPMAGADTVAFLARLGRPASPA